jgi:hypothetical protein
MLAAKTTLVIERSVLASLGQTPDPAFLQYQNFIVTREGVSKIMFAAERVPDDIFHQTMAIGGMGEVEEKIEELARAGVRHFAVVDLVPKRVRRTMNFLCKIIKQIR